MYDIAPLPKTRYFPSGLQAWLWWVGACALGQFLSLGILVITIPQADATLILGVIVPVNGLAVGFAQSLVLRHYIQGVRWLRWILFTAAGSLIAWASIYSPMFWVAQIIDSYLVAILVGSVVSATIAFAQVWVLRRGVKTSLYWVAIHALAGALAMLIGGVFWKGWGHVGQIAGLSIIESYLELWFISMAAGSLVWGAVSAVSFDNLVRPQEEPTRAVEPPARIAEGGSAQEAILPSLPKRKSKHVKWVALLLVLGVTLVAIGVPAARLSQLLSLQTLPPQLVTSPVCGAWRIYVPTSSFDVVTALSKEEIWFGGRQFARWNGTDLDMMPGPDLKPEKVIIAGIGAVSSTDAWAVGYTIDTEEGQAWVGQGELLTLHWDGKEWRSVPTPTSVTTSSGEVVPIKSGGPFYGGPSKHPQLTGVTAISSNNVWAVGYYPYPGTGVYKTLTLHWDGTAWHVVASPNVGGSDNSLEAVTSLSESDVWAFGEQNGQSLALHWDGISWKVVEITGSKADLWQGIRAAAVSASGDIWVVNAVSSLGSAVKESGTAKWRAIPLPYVEQPILTSIAALSYDDVWAAGHKWSGSPAEANYSQIGTRSLIMHWDGKSWSEVPGPDPSWIQTLNSVAAASRDNIWVVGTTSDHEDRNSRPMLAHFVRCSDAEDNIIGVP